MAIYITDSLLWGCQINICATECLSENLINEIFCAIVCDSISFVTLRSTFKNFMTETLFASKYFNFFGLSFLSILFYFLVLNITNTI